MPTTIPPPAPNRYDEPEVFSDETDAFLQWMATGFAEGQYLLEGVATPVVPDAGNVIITGRLAAGVIAYPAISMSNGVIRDLQIHLAKSNVGIWTANFGGTSMLAFGNTGTGLGATGTATAAYVSTANKYGRIPRLEYLTTVAATNAVAGFRSFGNFCTVGGAAAGEGGFHFYGVWGPATGVSNTTNRSFFGAAASLSAPTDVEPSTQIDCIGLGWDAADARLQIMHNDGSGACTKINLGTSFTVPTTDRAAMYSLELYSPPGTVQSVNYLVTDLITGNTSSGTITTNIPTTTTLLGLRGYSSAGGTSSVVGFALSTLYLDMLN